MRRTEYETYMRSAAWTQKRQARLALDGQRCRMCDEDGTRFPLEVHHRPSSYRRIPHESVQDDLITVCSRCHEQITDAIRRDRYGRRTVPHVEIITEEVHIRLEVNDGMASPAIQVSLLGPADSAQRADRQPARQVGQVDQTDFVQTRQDRR